MLPEEKKMWGFVITALSVVAKGLCENNPIVSIGNGRVKGVTEKSFSGIDYFAFHSIPYAKPPVGELRFNVRKIQNDNILYGIVIT